MIVAPAEFAISYLIKFDLFSWKNIRLVTNCNLQFDVKQLEPVRIPSWYYHKAHAMNFISG